MTTDANQPWPGPIWYNSSGRRLTDDEVKSMCVMAAPPGPTFAETTARLRLLIDWQHSIETSWGDGVASKAEWRKRIDAEIMSLLKAPSP
jgi:hypothetical protein